MAVRYSARVVPTKYKLILVYFLQYMRGSSTSQNCLEPEQSSLRNLCQRKTRTIAANTHCLDCTERSPGPQPCMVNSSPNCLPKSNPVSKQPLIG